MTTHSAWFLALFSIVVLAGDLELQLVQVLMRHGDRTPVSEIPNYAAEWWCNTNILSDPGQGDNLAEGSPQRIHRSVYMLNRNVLLGNCSAGQLTSIGAAQQQQLGAQFRQVYIEQQGFLNNSYDPQQIFVRSADVPRCFQSAENFLLGLFPLDDQYGYGATEVIPIYTIDESKDDMSLNPDLCPKIYELIAEHLVENLTFVEHLLGILAPTEITIAKVFGTDDPLVALEYFDNLNCRLAHNIPFPPGITMADFDVFQQAYWYMGTALFEGTYQLAIGPFVAEVLAAMQSTVSGTNPYKFMLYSGHDTSVAPFLAALGAYSGEWPPYASHIVFELYTSNSGGEPQVHFMYNGDELTVPACGSSMCPLSTFQELVEQLVPANYAEACKVEQSLAALKELSKKVVRLQHVLA